jgi:hypothetical protein
MSDLDHQRAIELLPDFFEKSLSADDQRQLEAHLASCASCSKEWTSYQSMMSALSGLGRNEQPAPNLFEGTASKIQKRTQGRFFSTPVLLGLSFEIVAIALLCFFIALYIVFQLMRAPAPTLPEPSVAPTSKPQQSEAEPRPNGSVAYRYTLFLASTDSPDVRSHLARIALTASATLNDWKQTARGMEASTQVASEKFRSFYVDLGSNYKITEDKSSFRSRETNPLVPVTIVLSPAPL